MWRLVHRCVSKLLPDVTRLFEIELEFYELRSLGAREIRYDVAKREFEFFHDNAESLKDKVSFLANVGGKRTLISEVIGLWSPVVKEWYDNYWLHFLFPFKAMVKPLTARAMINVCSRGRERLRMLDPFCGSGTFLVEGKVLGHDVYGVDIMPAYVELSRVKLDFFHMKPPSSFGDMDENLRKIVSAYGDVLSEKSRERRVSERIEEVLESFALRDKIISKLNLGRHKVSVGDARELEFDDEFFDVIVTSPPYNVAHNYFSYDKPLIEAFSTREEIERIKRKFMWARDESKFLASLGRTYEEMLRVIKPGGRIGIVIGNQKRKNKITDLVGWTIRWFENRGWKLICDVEEFLASRRVYKIPRDNILIFKS